MQNLRGLQTNSVILLMTYDTAWMVKRYGDFFEKFGIDDKALLAHFDEWKAESNDDSVTNYIWYLFHVLLGETRKQVTSQPDYFRSVHEIYLMMLEFRVGVEGQKDNSLVQAIIKNRIRLWQTELPYSFQLQAISLNCCDFCESINGQVFTAEEVLHHTHFATEKCTKEGGCSCGYIPVGEL